MKTRIRSFILAMLLVLSMATSSLAAGTDPVADLRLLAGCESDTVTLNVYLTAKSATNGRIVIGYESDYVTLVDAVTDDSWITSVNSEGKGEVKFAWVGSDVTATAKVLTLVFQVITDEIAEITFTGEMSDIYADGVDMSGGSTIYDTVTVEIGQSGEAPEDPTPPSPQPPIGGDDPVVPDVPVTPGGPGGGDDGGDDDEDKPGTDTPEMTREEYEAILIKYPDIRGHWAEESIVKAIYASLFKGKTENTFDPEGVVTRGMFVTLLYRLSGEPAVSGGMPFTDVPLTQYYADAVKWAYENNIVTGVTATEFKPDLEVTREQMVTMLYRYARFIGDDVSASVSLSGFGDADKVNDFAVEAMRWAVAELLINGSNGNLNPGGFATRAEIATLLVRYAGL